MVGKGRTYRITHKVDIDGLPAIMSLRGHKPVVSVDPRALKTVKASAVVKLAGTAADVVSAIAALSSRSGLVKLAKFSVPYKGVIRRGKN